jgi:hypothetical protein
MYISPVSQEWPKGAEKASLLTASRMLLHAFQSMFVRLLHTISGKVYDKQIITCHFLYHILYQPSFI